LGSAFIEAPSAGSNALLDVNEIGTILELWMRDNPDFGLNPCVVLSVDAVAFKLMVTIYQDRWIAGLNQVNQIDVHLFDKFVGQPPAFAAFLTEHWADAESALFVFQVQPLDPRCHCDIIHVVPETHGKGTTETVSRLFHLKHLLSITFHLGIWRIAFDGDSRFNGFRN
jgi:hypothetical protein